MDATKQQRDGEAIAKEAIDFESAKNFWQTREARSQSRDGAPPPMPTSTNSSSASDSDARPSVVAPSNTGTRNQPATPIEQYPDEMEREKDAAATAVAAAPPPAPTAASTATTQAAAALHRMTSFRSKLFSTNTTTNDGKISDDTSPSASLPSMMSMPAVQLPDMSSWKGKMKISRPSPPKMNFSFEKLSTQLKTSLNNTSLIVSDAQKAEQIALARNNIHRPSSSSKSKRPVAAAATTKNDALPFGQLIVAEVLAAKELAAGDFFQGESDPYIILTFQDCERRTAIVKGSKHPVFNERFVFWTPCSSVASSTESESESTAPVVSIVVMNKNMVMTDEHLGEVHIALDTIPANKSFDEWYPLVKETPGEQKGHVRVGVRRMELTSKAHQASAQALAQATSNRSLNDEDLATHGAVLPELWYGFAEAAEPLEAKVSQADVLATKLNDLSRRFIGIEIASKELTADGQRRDIF